MSPNYWEINLISHASGGNVKNIMEIFIQPVSVRQWAPCWPNYPPPTSNYFRTFFGRFSNIFVSNSGQKFLSFVFKQEIFEGGLHCPPEVHQIFPGLKLRLLPCVGGGGGVGRVWDNYDGGLVSRLIRSPNVGHVNAYCSLLYTISKVILIVFCSRCSLSVATQDHRQTDDSTGFLITLQPGPVGGLGSTLASLSTDLFCPQYNLQGNWPTYFANH